MKKQPLQALPDNPVRLPKSKKLSQRAASARPDVPAWRRKLMQANKSKDTKPEKKVRSALHQLGYRFRLHRRDLPGCPDIVFTARRVAIQIYGCFWHQHQGCRLARIPKTRISYWQPKFARTVQHDREAENSLAEQGWTVVIVWECEMTANFEKVLQRIVNVLGLPQFVVRRIVQDGSCNRAVIRDQLKIKPRPG